MNENDCRKYFEEWLTAYSDHLHMVRQGTGIDAVQPNAAQSPIGVSADKSKDTIASQQKPSA